MHSSRLGRTLAVGVLVVAAFSTLAALTLPVNERRPPTAMAVLWLALLLMHAAIYWFGDIVRARVGLRGYVAAQAAIVLAVGLTGALFPVGIALYIVLTAETVVIAGPRWGTVPITFVAIVLFAANAIAVSDLYRGATAGMLLAITGVVAHAAAALAQRRQSGTIPEVAPTAPVHGVAASSNLTQRELQVLRAIVGGARSGQIATDLGIAERTVKAHLASIYQKLGVDSRAAAVAAAIQRGIT